MLRLNLGAGPVRILGELGVDREAVPAVDIRADVGALPFRAGCAQFVRAEHLLEHLTMGQALQAVQEMRRVLAPGGELRVSVPDFPATAQAYLSAPSPEGRAAVLRWVYGSQQHAGEYHRSGWDRELLATVLLNAGFGDVRVEPDPTRAEGIGIVATARRGNAS